MDKRFLARNTDTAEDLLGWARRLGAIGYVISSIASHEDPGQVLTGETGEYLGHIISDYAGAVLEVAETAYWPIKEFYEKGEDSLVAEVNKELRRLKNDFCSSPYNLTCIEEALEKIEPILTESAILSEQRKELLGLKDRIKKGLKEP
jgi:hypothetical protein